MIPRPQKRDSLAGYALAAAIGIAALIVVSLLGMSRADAGGVCRVVRAPLVSHDYYYPKIRYRVADPLREEAVATYQLRKSDEYKELQDLRIYKQAIETAAIIAQGNSGDRPSGPPQPATGHPAATEEGQTTEPPAAPVSAFAARYPTLAANCLKCHTGDSPKGDVFLDGTVPLDGPDAASKRDAIAAAIINLKMPKNKPLDDQHQYNALVELFSEPSPDTTSPNEGDSP